MKIKLAVLCAGIALFCASPVWATGYTFNFNNCSTISSPSPLPAGGLCPGNLGTSTATFGSGVSGTPSITASGYSSSSFNPAGLNIRNDSPSEQGLGLVSDPSGNREISNGQFIYLRFSNFTDNGLTSATIDFSSLQQGTPDESALVCEVFLLAADNCYPYVTGDSNAQGSLTVNWNSTDTNPLFSFTARPTNLGSSYGNFLISSVSASSATPEPGTLVLFGSALLGLAFVFRRRHGMKTMR